MKSAYLKKLAAGVLVAAMAVTAVPAVSQLVNPTVTAQAAKKKKKAKKTKNAKVTWLGTAFDKTCGVFVGKQSLSGNDLVIFSDYKSSGKYTFTTNSKNLSIKLDNSSIKSLKEEYGNDWTRNNDYLSYDVTAKKPGTYKVTIKEKYKGKTRTLKKNAKLYVYEPEAISDECTAYIGNYYDPDMLLSNAEGPIGDYNFDIVEGKDTVLSVVPSGDDEYDEVAGDLQPIAEGSAKVKVTDLYGNDCGTVTVNVKSNHCTKLELTDYAYYYDDNENMKEGMSISRYNSETAQEGSQDITDYYKAYGEDEDYDVSDPVTVTSSNPAVASVSNTNFNGDQSDYWDVAPQSAGDAVLTITCGSQSVQLPVHVKIYSDDEDY